MLHTRFARGFTLTALLFAGVALFLLYSSNEALRSEADAYETQQAALLQQIEAADLRQLSLQQQIDRTEEALRASDTQLSRLSEELQQMQQLLDLDYAALRDRVREELLEEDQNLREQQQLSSARRLQSPEFIELQTRIRVNSAYNRFFAEANFSPNRELELRQLLLEIVATQSAASGLIATDPSQRENYADVLADDYVLTQLEGRITAEELRYFQEFEAGKPEREARSEYESLLDRNVSSFNDAERGIVIDAFIREFGAEPRGVWIQNNTREQYNRRLETLQSVRQELTNEFDARKMLEIDSLLEAMRADYEFGLRLLDGN